MNRRQFISKTSKTVFAAITTSILTDVSFGMASSAEKSRPNIIFILIDDMGWTDAGCLGSDFYKTPNIDKLRKQSMYFTDAYMASPVCAPSRASVVMGKYPVRFELNKVFSSLEPKRNQKLIEPVLNPNVPSNYTSIADALKFDGYSTACIGKWHLGDKQHGPETQGFDYVYHKPEKRNPNDHKLINYLTDKSIDFMEINRNKPFFLYLAHYAMHHDYSADTKLIEKYRKKIRPGMTHFNPIYAANLERLDDGIGRLMKKVDDLGLTKNTVVFFTSDNGGRKGNVDYVPGTNNYPLKQSKHTLYEGGIRVPLFVRWPGVIKPNTTCTAPVHSNDFFPTIIDITGTGKESYDFTDGISFKLLLMGKGDENKFESRPLIWYFPCYNEGVMWGKFTVFIARPCAAVRLGDYKLIEYFEDKNEVELYNVRRDISEVTNLVNAMPEKVQQLRDILAKWYKDYNVKLPCINPDYDPRFGWVRVKDMEDLKAGK